MAKLQTRRTAAATAILSMLLAVTGGCAASSTCGTAEKDQAPSYLPYAVPFVGVQDIFGRNALGDAIVITAVHGTADTFAIGNTYRIDGAYTLASHDQATLSTYMTDTRPDAPRRKMVPGQSLSIRKGSGTFTVFLKVEDRGCPHVSFYPGNGGQSFSGEYYGTGSFLPPESWRLKNQLASHKKDAG